MRKIEILGTGCPKCREATKRAEQAVRELGIDAKVAKVEDIQKIMDYSIR